VKPKLTQADLMRVLHYDPDTGIFSRAAPAGRWGHIPAGTVVGTADPVGYLHCVVNGTQYKLHRLAFIYMTGESLPDDVEVDHVNGLKGDNRWKNLRPANHRQNQENRRRANRSARRTSRYLGVYWHKGRGKWMARIKVNFRSRYLGLFTCEADAHDAYLRAKQQLHEFAPVNDNRPAAEAVA